MQETNKTWIRSLGQEDALEQAIATLSSIFAGKSHRQRSLAGYSPQNLKQSDATVQLRTRIVHIYDNKTKSILTA